MNYNEKLDGIQAEITTLVKSEYCKNGKVPIDCRIARNGNCETCIFAKDWKKGRDAICAKYEISKDEFYLFLNAIRKVSK